MEKGGGTPDGPGEGRRNLLKVDLEKSRWALGLGKAAVGMGKVDADLGKVTVYKGKVAIGLEKSPWA